MDLKLGNPAPIGLCGFALTTWLLSMINVGWYGPEALPMVLACAIVFGGTAQFIAGLMELPRGNSFGFVAFCGYGAFWWSFAVFVIFFSNKVPGSFVGWYLLIWGVFTTFMWFASLKKNKALQRVFLALFITFYLLAFGAMLSIPALSKLGGYFGLLTALLAFYLAAGEVINESYGRTVLPL